MFLFQFIIRTIKVSNMYSMSTNCFLYLKLVLFLFDGPEGIICQLSQVMTYEVFI